MVDTKFTPRDDQPLKPEKELLNNAQVTQDDVDNSVEKWTEKPPDKDFKLILKAENDD